MQTENTNIDSICGHIPLVTIRRFTQSRPLALDGGLDHGECVSEKSGAGDVDIFIIFFQASSIPYIWALGWIANLLYDVVNWVVDCKLMYYLSYQTNDCFVRSGDSPFSIPWSLTPLLIHSAPPNFLMN